MLKLQGSWLAAQREKAGEMQPRRGRPRCPKRLSAQAKQIWEYFMPELDFAGVMTLADRETFALYCQLTAEWWELTKFLAEHGTVYTIKNAEGKAVDVREYPQSRQRGKITEQLVKLGREFGLTPASRSRVRPILDSEPGTNDDSEHNKFFGTA